MRRLLFPANVGVKIAASLMTVSLLAAACGDQAGTEVRAKGIPQDAPQPDTVPAASAATTGFATDLYRQLSTRPGNLVFSPFAVALGLGMARVGADGDTASQLTSVLHATQDSALDTGLGTTSTLLADRTGERQSDLRKGRVDLSIVSALWGQQGTRFDPTFLDRLARSYGTGMRVIDFRSDPEAGRKAINSWAADETDDAITQLVPRGAITQLTRFVLASTIALQAPWQVVFPADQTRLSPFRLLDGQAVSVPTMTVRDQDAFAYGRGDGYEALSLPYLGRELSMVVILPADGTFTQFEQGLDGARLDSIVRSLAPTPVELHLPRFQFTTESNLNDPLADAGMPVAFSRDAADFSGITGDESLAISDVIHQTFVAADEQGTDGAATTVVTGQSPPRFSATTMTIDRPFVFLIRDEQTGTALMLGRVLNPLE